MSHKPYYITTTLPYLNADPHIGFALEIIRADVTARIHTSMGEQVFFSTGADEHGKKMYEKALELGMSPQDYVDQCAERFRGLKDILGLVDNLHFIRTTEKRHHVAAQEFWRRVNENGYIEKKKYQAKYCVGCELEKTDSELVDGKCPIHNNRELELIDEENYFFKFSAFAEKLVGLYEKEDFILPDFRLNEIRSFVARGLDDFSVSRLKSKMPWGVPVPGDDEHVMYVWFDALVNYVSTLDWPDEGVGGNFDTFWKNGETLQLCGKDNLRQQSAMWQAMLMAADLPPTNQIMVGGFINSGGQKMSKSLGNVINPYDVIDRYRDVTEYASDVLRYYLMRHVHPYDDSDVTVEKIDEAYNANLANGLGNLVSRLMNMVVSYDVEIPSNLEDLKLYPDTQVELVNVDEEKSFRFDKILDEIWFDISSIDEKISKEEPFKLIKSEPERAKEILKNHIHHLYGISLKLEPFMPETAKKIQELIINKQKPEKPLFLRKE